jgi:hypothetical protein
VKIAVKIIAVKIDDWGNLVDFACEDPWEGRQEEIAHFVRSELWGATCTKRLPSLTKGPVFHYP